jgi:hypothetical protein
LGLAEPTRADVGSDSPTVEPTVVAVTEPTALTLSTVSKATVSKATKATITEATLAASLEATLATFTEATVTTITEATVTTITEATLATFTEATVTTITEATVTTITEATVTTITEATVTTITEATVTTITEATVTTFTEATLATFTEATLATFTEATLATSLEATLATFTSLEATVTTITEATLATFTSLEAAAVVVSQGCEAVLRHGLRRLELGVHDAGTPTLAARRVERTPRAHGGVQKRGEALWRGCLRCWGREGGRPPARLGAVAPAKHAGTASVRLGAPRLRVLRVPPGLRRRVGSISPAGAWATPASGSSGGSVGARRAPVAAKLVGGRAAQRTRGYDCQHEVDRVPVRRALTHCPPGPPGAEKSRSLIQELESEASSRKPSVQPGDSASRHETDIHN